MKNWLPTVCFSMQLTFGIKIRYTTTTFCSLTQNKSQNEKFVKSINELLIFEKEIFEKHQQIVYLVYLFLFLQFCSCVMRYGHISHLGQVNFDFCSVQLSKISFNFWQYVWPNFSLQLICFGCRIKPRLTSSRTHNFFETHFQSSQITHQRSQRCPPMFWKDSPKLPKVHLPKLHTQLFRKTFPEIVNGGEK